MFAGFTDDECGSITFGNLFAIYKPFVECDFSVRCKALSGINVNGLVRFSNRRRIKSSCRIAEQPKLVCGFLNAVGLPTTVINRKRDDVASALLEGVRNFNAFGGEPIAKIPAIP